MKRSCEHLCPMFQTAMDVLARPWNGLVIATLEGGPLRFSEIGDRLRAIGDRMLSLRLKELEGAGLVERRVISGPPLRVEYELTEAGRGFRKVSEAIATWGATLTGARKAEGCPEAEAELDDAKAHVG
jgi:DNA-binding HxlR family transcriptional regulator